MEKIGVDLRKEGKPPSEVTLRVVTRETTLQMPTTEIGQEVEIEDTEITGQTAKEMTEVEIGIETTIMTEVDPTVMVGMIKEGPTVMEEITGAETEITEVEMTDITIGAETTVEVETTTGVEITVKVETSEEGTIARIGIAIGIEGHLPVIGRYPSSSVTSVERQITHTTNVH